MTLDIVAGTQPLVPASGSRRNLDIRWPGHTGNQFGTAVDLVPSVRYGSVSSRSNLTAASVNGNTFLREYKGRSCVNLATTLVAGSIARITHSTQPTFPLQALAADLEPGPVDCWEVVADLAWSNPAAAIARDCGLVLAWENAINPISTGALGHAAFIGLECRGPQSLALCTRGTGNVDASLSAVKPVVVPDIQDWHTYKFRIIGAIQGVPAQLKFFVDAALIYQMAFDNVLIANTWQTAGANQEYGALLVSLVNDTAIVQSLYCARWEMHGASTEDALT